VHRPGLDLYCEQHVQALEKHGVNVQEVTGEDAVCLGGQELPPGQRRPSRCWPEVGGGQDPADGSLSHSVAQAEQLALDTPVPQRGFSRASCSTSARTSAVTGGRPEAFGYVHFRVTSRRCQASKVPESRSGAAAGVPAAASPGRRAQRGQPSPAVAATCRRKTATSWRRTKISASLAASLRASSASQPSTRTMNR
jgi:hypothetical protein